MGVKAGEHSLVRAAIRNPLALEQLGFAGKGYLGEECRQKRTSLARP